MAVFTTQYRIRYTIPTDDGNREIHSIICNDRYKVQININNIIVKKSKGYEFIELDDRTIDINYTDNLNPNYSWKTIFNF